MVAFRSVPCDAELQELMHQIDIMVNKKKLEWEKKVQGLEARMTIRDQELASAQSKLDQKGQEVMPHHLSCQYCVEWEGLCGNLPWMISKKNNNNKINRSQPG